MPLSTLKEIKTGAVKPEAIKPIMASEDTGSVVIHSDENRHLMIAEAPKKETHVAPGMGEMGEY